MRRKILLPVGPMGSMGAVCNGSFLSKHSAPTSSLGVALLPPDPCRCRMFKCRHAKVHGQYLKDLMYMVSTVYA